MKLHIVPASRGWHWVRQAAATLRAQPLALTSLFFISIVLLQMVALLPAIGAIAAPCLIPALTLGYMNATCEATQGRLPRPQALFVGFTSGRTHLQALLVLGALYTAGFALCLLLTRWIDGGEFWRIFVQGQRLTDKDIVRLMQSAPFLQAITTFGALTTALSLIFWHAPALAYWHHIAPAKSLFFSAIASLRNIKAFMMLYACWIGCGLAAIVLASLPVAILPAFLGQLLLMLLSLFLATLYFTTQYMAYQDCFLHTPPADTAQT